MTVHERIERLTERHEALAESVEMLRDRTGEIAQSVDRLTAAVSKLIEITNQDAESIRALARIDEAHERRITDIEGGQA
jgi:archaellum component FlaC